jgi:hypothetical protein
MSHKCFKQKQKNKTDTTRYGYSVRKEWQTHTNYTKYFLDKSNPLNTPLPQPSKSVPKAQFFYETMISQTTPSETVQNRYNAVGAHGILLDEYIIHSKAILLI